MKEKPVFTDEELMVIEKCTGQWKDDTDKPVYMIQVTGVMLDRISKKCKDYRINNKENLK